MLNLSVKFPEGQLIFEAHLYRARMIYDTIDEPKRKQLTTYSSFRRIAEYIEQIPSEFLKEKSKNNQAQWSR